jgi:hypothetical protein
MHIDAYLCARVCVRAHACVCACVCVPHDAIVEVCPRQHHGHTLRRQLGGWVGRWMGAWVGGWVGGCVRVRVCVCLTMP